MYKLVKSDVNITSVSTNKVPMFKLTIEAHFESDSALVKRKRERKTPLITMAEIALKGLEGSS